MSIFSEISEDKKIHKGEYFFMVYDGFPVSPGHILIISNEIYGLCDFSCFPNYGH